MKFFSTVLFVLNLYNIESLELSKWTIFNSNREIYIENVSSPVDTFSALFENSKIDWPWKHFNDIKYRWIGNENFTFQSEPFSIDERKYISLYVSGLDIQPIISLNDHFIGSTLSEFISKDFIINSSIVKKSGNILKLFFVSPLLLANNTASRNNYKVPPDCWPPEFHGDCHINFIRKTQASFGWDWGPSIPAIGIRGKIEFHTTNKIIGKIRNINILIKTNENCTIWSAIVKINVFLLLDKNLNSEICVENKIRDLKLHSTQCLIVRKSGITNFIFHLNLDRNILQLWWPFDLGNPVLYEMHTSLLYSNDVIDNKLEYIGFRSVSLKQTLLPNNYGRYFGFTINCQPFFIKGTNWVPRTYMTNNWNNNTFIEFLLYSVSKANMNTIRLWGGGKPESKHFYETADRLGIMIWHDLMFACALYPNNDQFISGVSEEVTEIISNLQIHPSILVWSGNNEIEVLIAQGWYNTNQMDPVTIRRYYNLFGEIIKPIVTSIDPYIPFIFSSPSNGIESEKNYGVSINPQSLFYGDVHFYLYEGDLWNQSLYPVTRMTTEFGFQSFPIMKTWEFMIQSDDDYEIDGSLMKHLQHHPGGNKQIIDALRFYFGKLYPNNTLLAGEKYKWFSYLSQINQAIILKVHISKLLSHQCILTNKGLGLTRGAMYWQLNDNWIAPTWSTIDWFGQWKIAHYYVKNSFSPERINIEIIDDVISFTIILPEKISQTEYNLRIRSFNITKPIESSIIVERNSTFNTTEFKCNVETILSVKIIDFLQMFSCWNKNQCLFEIYLIKNLSILFNEGFMFVHPSQIIIPKEVANDKVLLKIKQDITDLTSCSIILQSHYIHFYATLTTSSWGIFSNNGFHITRNQIMIKFIPWYVNANRLFNCSQLAVEINSLNTLFL